MATDKYKEQFIQDVIRFGQEGKTIAQTAAAFGIDRHTLYAWSKDVKKPEFMEAYKLARTCAQGYHEDILIKGIKGLLPKYNAVSHIFFMKNSFKEDYRDTSEQRIDINNTVKTMTDEELDETIKVLVARKTKKDNDASGAPTNPGVV